MPQKKWSINHGTIVAQLKLQQFRQDILKVFCRNQSFQANPLHFFVNAVFQKSSPQAETNQNMDFEKSGQHFFISAQQGNFSHYDKNTT